MRFVNGAIVEKDPEKLMQLIEEITACSQRKKPDFRAPESHLAKARE